MDCNKNKTVISKNLASFSGKRCIVGIDEAGRGPVLGPMVYGIGICLIDEDERLKTLGVDDSKVLTDVRRVEIFKLMNNEECSEYFAYALEILSPHFISVSMLKRCKYNLNEISHDAAIGLVELCIKSGLIVEKVFVDTVGPPESYQKKLGAKFPRAEVCVSKKADSLFPIVSAASICAKVTRDNLLKEWTCTEFSNDDSKQFEFGSGYPAGTC